MQGQIEFNTKYEHTFTVTIDSVNKNQFFLDKNSPVKGFNILYIKTRRDPDDGGVSLQGATIVSNGAFSGAFLVIKVRQTEVLNRIPLPYIENATTQVPAVGYPIFLKDIDWEQSFIEVAPGVTLTADQVWEFTVTFTKK